jgi:peptidoglycan/xylan/chitin deacetylase (PgdA/CDA1 family)
MLYSKPRMPTYSQSSQSIKFNFKKNFSKLFFLIVISGLIGFSIQLLASNNKNKSQVIQSLTNSNSLNNNPSIQNNIKSSESIVTDKKPEIKKLSLPVKSDIKLPVIMYHHINNLDGIPSSDAVGIGLRISEQALEKQLLYLKENNYTTINSFQLYDYWKQATSLPEKPILLTFDDGYIDNYTKALPLLQKYKMVGDFAIITKVIGTGEYMNYDQLKDILKAGSSISSHTQLHCSLAYKQKDGSFLETPVVQVKDIKDECPSLNYPSQMNSNQVKNELINSKKTLEDNLGIKVTTLVYPFGHHNKQTQAFAREVGYEFAFTVMPQGNEDLDLSSPFNLPRYRANGQQDSTLRGFFAGGR